MLPDTFDTPVLLIVFNRPDLTQRVLTILKENRVDNLFIAFDAPRNNSQEEVDACKGKKLSFILQEILLKKLIKRQNNFMNKIQN